MRNIVFKVGCGQHGVSGGKALPSAFPAHCAVRYWAGIWVLLAVILAVTVAGCASKEERIAQYLESARGYYAARDFKSAVLELKNVVQLEPKHEEAHFQLGETYMALGELALAVQSYVEAVSLNPDNLNAHLKAGQIFLAAQKTMEARRAAKRILKKEPDNIDALQLLAAVQIQEKDMAAAIKTLQTTIALSPDNSKPYFFLANAYFNTGNLDDAEKAYLQTISMDPSAPGPFALLIEVYGRKKQWTEARRVLRQMPAMTGGDKELVDAALFCENHQQLDLAEKIYLKAIAIAPKGNAAPMAHLGDYYARRKDYAKAMDRMDRALEIQKDDPTILAKKAALFIETGELDRAEEAVGTALLKDGNHVSANFVKGKLFFLKKDFSRALDKFNQTIAFTPDNAMAYYYKALCLAGKGYEGRNDPDLFRTAAGFHEDADAWTEKQVEENLLKAVSLNPKLLNAKMVLAEIYLRNRDLQNAREQIMSAGALVPGSIEILTLQGSLKILEGDFKGALAVSQKVLAQRPDDSLWHYRSGIVYLLMKQPEKALGALEKTLALNPMSMDAFDLMVEIHLRNRDYEKAFRLCRERRGAVADAPGATGFIDNAEGRIYLAMGNMAAARRLFLKAVTDAPSLISPRMSLAGIYARQAQPELALGQYEAILNLNPNMLVACMAVGDIHYHRGNDDLAETYYRRALMIKNGYGPAANNLAFLLSEKDDKLREAYNFAQLAEKKMPDNANVKDTLGWIHYRMGNNYQAIVEFEKSLSLDTENTLANYHLGLAYYKNNEFEKARTRLKKALSLDPDFKGADEARIIVDE